MKDHNINFINASNIHPEISPIYWMQFPSTIYVKMFADKCLKMKLLMIYELYHAEF